MLRVLRDGDISLHEVTRELEADYRRFSKTRSLRFNLAYAEGFEALTTASARFAFENGVGSKMTAHARDLFTWHLLEELEHRTVAFEVYAHVCGGYFYRLFAGLYAQWHMSRFIRRVTKLMLKASPEVLEACGGDAGRQVAPVGRMRGISIKKESRSR